MNDCLVTKLKSIVNDELPLRYNYMNCQVTPIGQPWQEFEFKLTDTQILYIVGDGHFCDANGNEIFYEGSSKKFLREKGKPSKICISDGTYILQLPKTNVMSLGGTGHYGSQFLYTFTFADWQTWHDMTTSWTFQGIADILKGRTLMELLGDKPKFTSQGIMPDTSGEAKELFEHIAANCSAHTHEHFTGNGIWTYDGVIIPKGEQHQVVYDGHGGYTFKNNAIP